MQLVREQKECTSHQDRLFGTNWQAEEADQMIGQRYSINARESNSRSGDRDACGTSSNCVLMRLDFRIQSKCKLMTWILLCPAEYISCVAFMMLLGLRNDPILLNSQVLPKRILKISVSAGTSNFDQPHPFCLPDCRSFPFCRYISCCIAECAIYVVVLPAHRTLLVCRLASSGRDQVVTGLTAKLPTQP